jgi:hypothetical protein
MGQNNDCLFQNDGLPSSRDLNEDISNTERPTGNEGTESNNNNNGRSVI